MNKHSFAPNIDNSITLWEELSTKIPDLLLVGIFTMECNYEIDGLGRLYSQQAKRGAYNISSFINEKKMIRSKRVFSPLMAKHMNLLPTITTKISYNKHNHEESLKKETNKSINHEKILNNLRSSWEFLMDNFDTILPRIKITTYCVERHLISKKISYSSMGCKTTVKFSTRIQPISNHLPPFYVEKEYSFPKTDYQLIIPEEFNVNTMITNFDSDLKIVLSPQATLELIYSLYLNSYSLLKSTNNNEFIVNPESKNNIVKMDLDDTAEKRVIRELSDKINHPVVHARVMSIPLHDAGYIPKKFPVHIDWDGEKTAPLENMILIERLGMNADIFHQKNQIIITGYNSYLIREGEIVAFIPQLTFSIPKLDKLFSNFLAISEKIWISPMNSPISAELPYFSIKNFRIKN